MGEHIKIVDFFGLPGCGKSTLERELVGKSNIDINFCTMSDVSNMYRHEGVLNKLLWFPYRTCFLWLVFFTLMPKLRRGDRYIYKSFFLITIVYAYCHRVKIDKTMLVDHGVVQSVVSLMYGKIDQLSSLQAVVFNRIVSILDIDYLFYCKISPASSLCRIRKRNRLDSGRLDKIDKDDELVSVLYGQSLLFDSISGLVDCQIIDMDSSVSDIVEVIEFKLLKR